MNTNVIGDGYFDLEHEARNVWVTAWIQFDPKKDWGRFDSRIDFAESLYQAFKTRFQQINEV